MNTWIKAAALATTFGSAVMAGNVQADGSYMDELPGHCIYMGDYALYVANQRLKGAAKDALEAAIPEANKTFGIPSSLAHDVIDTLWDVDPQKIVFEPLDAGRFAHKAIQARKDGAAKKDVIALLPLTVRDVGITQAIAADIVHDVWAIDQDDLEQQPVLSLVMKLETVNAVEDGYGGYFSPSALRAHVYMNCRQNYEDLLNELMFDDGADVPTKAPKLGF